MNTSLSDVRGISKFTLRIFKLAGYNTFGDLLSFDGDDRRIGQAVAELQRLPEFEGYTPKTWRFAITRCINIINRCGRKAYPVPPNCFMCPITLQLIEDPVISPSGYSYERDAMEAWISQNHNDPLTSQNITVDQLVPNRLLKDAIEDYKLDTTSYII